MAGANIAKIGASTIGFWVGIVRVDMEEADVRGVGIGETGIGKIGMGGLDVRGAGIGRAGIEKVGVVLVRAGVDSLETGSRSWPI